MPHDQFPPGCDWSRRGFLVSASASIRPSAQTAASGQPIVCRVIDKESGGPVPARVRLVDHASTRSTL